MNNILIVSDIHAPYTHKNYLNHCKKIYKKYKCNKVVFIGDLVDNTALSYHDLNMDLPSVGDELQKALDQLQAWYKTFPTAIVTLGNHDLRIAKRALKSGLSTVFIKAFNEIIQAPKGWKFVDQIIIDKVLYRHGDIDAYKKCQQEHMSVVSGHHHTKAGIEYYTNNNHTIFGMHTGAGIDDSSLAFAYAKGMSKRSVLACGVVIDGKQGILELM